VVAVSLERVGRGGEMGAGGEADGRRHGETGRDGVGFGKDGVGFGAGEEDREARRDGGEGGTGRAHPPTEEERWGVARAWGRGRGRVVHSDILGAREPPLHAHVAEARELPLHARARERETETETETETVREGVSEREYVSERERDAARRPWTCRGGSGGSAASSTRATATPSSPAADPPPPPPPPPPRPQLPRRQSS
jgi:hypothetical protein